MSNRTKAIVLLCAVALIAAACSSSRVTENPTASQSADGSSGDDTEGTDGGSGKKSKGKRKGKNAAEKAIGETAPNDPGAAAAGGGAIAEGGLQSLGPGGPEFARRSARYQEEERDAESGGPLVVDYADGMGLAVEGLGEDVRVTFTMSGQVPDRMVTPNTIMVIAFGLSGAKQDDGGYAFGAQGREDGWTAYAGAKKESRPFPGTFFVRGNKIEMTVPWEFIEGPRPFEFYASASWFRSSGNAETSSYSFDVIPDGKGRYPR